MGNTKYQIRVCQSCGLRYPIAEDHTFGVRCPQCLGETELILTRALGVDHQNVQVKKSIHISVLLDNIRSAWNVGAILRSADGFGFEHAFLCGITPTPEQEAVKKTALGAENHVPWSYHKDAVKLVKGLKKEGWIVLGLEETENSIDIQQWKKKPKKNIVLIAGGEVTGVDPELLSLCEAVYKIPMNGQKRSFNVSVAFGIAAYALS